MGRKRNQIDKIQKLAYPVKAEIIKTATTQDLKEAVKNSLAGCNPNSFGGNTNPFGFPGNGVSPESVENFDTTFNNLRWALVSNLRQLLSQAFVEIGLVQTIACLPVDDGLRGGFLFKSKQLDEDELKKLHLEMDRNDDFTTAGWASKWARLFGGGGIIVIVDDQDPEEEFDIASIDENTEIEFRDADLWELYSNIENLDDYDYQTQIHEFDFYRYYTEDIHKSRVMAVKGIKAPSFVRPRLRGWGLSSVEVLVRSLNQYLKATDLGFEVLDEFKLDVFKIKNLVNTLLAPDGFNSVRKMIQQLNMTKNYQNAMVIDSEDEFDHKQLSFAGLAEAMEGIRMQVAADMRMPIIKLFGQSVSKGLGTSAPDEMENYNAMVEAEVRNKLKWHLLRMGEIRSQQLFGFVPDDLEGEFKPLRELTPVDQETVKTAKFNRALQAKQAGELMTEEFRDICNKGNLFDIQLDTSEVALGELEEEAAAMMQDEMGGEEGESGLKSKSETPKTTGKRRRNLSDDEKRQRQKSKGDNKQPENKEPENKEPKVKNSLTKSYGTKIVPYVGYEVAVRLLNSPRFDKASYAADGGDGWIGDEHRELYENPGKNVDERLWDKAKEASMKSLGEENWKFVTWFYKKQGGKFK